MRPIILALCVSSAACSGQPLNSPTSPTAATVANPATAATLAAAQTLAQGGAQLPFDGSLRAVENDVIAPPNLLADGTAKGEATHLGRFTATFTAVVDLATSTSTGTFDFTAANGDHLLATFTGLGVTIEPGVASITEVATVVGGTGRFAATTGTFTVRRVLAMTTGVSSGSFDGHINLNN